MLGVCPLSLNSAAAALCATVLGLATIFISVHFTMSTSHGVGLPRRAFSNLFEAFGSKLGLYVVTIEVLPLFFRSSESQLSR